MLCTFTFWATVCKTVAPCYQTVLCPVLSCPVCLSVCLSVTLVYCGQTVGRIKMKLGMQVGLSPGHIVLDGDPLLPSPCSTKSPGLRPTSIPTSILMHPAIWPQQKWAKNQGGGSAPFLVRGAGSLSSTMWPGPRPTSMPSAILIHPAVWAQ